MATIHGRGQIQDIELAADADGKLTGVRVRAARRHGRLPAAGHPGHPAARRLPLRRRVRRAGGLRLQLHGVFTTMTPTDAYRGAGRPEATYAIERAMDALAAEVGVDPAELRRRNFIQKEAVPVHGLHRSRLRQRRPRRRARPRPPRWSTTTACAREQATQNVRGRAPSASASASRQLLRDVRTGPVTGAGIAELLRRRLGGGHGADPADQQGPGGHRADTARPGPRDVVVR